VFKINKIKTKTTKLLFKNKMNNERNLKMLFFLVVKKKRCNSEKENISNEGTKKYELKIKLELICTCICIFKVHVSV
jgi:hypothetical protein